MRFFEKEIVDMTLSEFCRKFYDKSSFLTIDNQENFIGLLFFVSGSKHFPKHRDKPDPSDNKKYSTMRKLFNGDTNFTSKMRKSIDNPIDEEKFVLGFARYVNEKSFINIMNNFGIENKEHPNKTFLLKALCRQFQKIVLEPEGAAEDIVVLEYMRLSGEIISTEPKQDETALKNHTYDLPTTHYGDESTGIDRLFKIENYIQFIKGKTDSIEFKGIEIIAGAKTSTKTLKLYAPLYIKNVHGISDMETTLHEYVFEERGIIIKGDPGSGKSTFVKYIVREELEKKANILPFIIQLEQFGKFIEKKDFHTKKESVELMIEYILQEYPQKNFNFDSKMLENIFSKGLGWFFFDGFDEIDSPIAKNKICILIDHIFDYWSESKFVITCRPFALDDDYTYLKDFQKVHIDILHREQMERYINNLAEIVNIDQYLIDANGLINKIRDNQAIHELAQTPVMLTFICLIYFMKDEIPENRYEIYEKTITWLIKTKHRNKLEQNETIKKYASIAIEMFAALRSKKDIGFEDLYLKFGGEQSKNTFLNTLNEDGIIVKTSGEDGIGEIYSFWHFCFEEYLAAKSLCEYMPVDFDYLLQHWFDPEWEEVIVLYSACLLAKDSHRMTAFVDTICKYLLSLDLGCCIKGSSLLGTIFKEVYPTTDFLRESIPWFELKKRIKIIFYEELPEISVQAKSNAAIAYGLSIDERIQDFEKTFIRIPQGHFFIGAQNIKPYRRKYDPKATIFEYPINEIYFAEFEIRKYPITVEEFEKFVENEGYNASKEIWTEEGHIWRDEKKVKYPRNWRRQIHLRNSPVTGISWFEATAYCNWLTVNSGGKYLYKLPSDSQWEYAFAMSHDIANIRQQQFNCYVNSEDIQTKTPIGIYPASTSLNGLTDMLGNVEEWCEDSWHNSLLKCPKDGSVFVDEKEVGAVCRGGSTIRTKRLCRYTYRSRSNKDARYDTIGFRIVRQDRGAYEPGI